MNKFCTLILNRAENRHFHTGMSTRAIILLLLDLGICATMRWVEVEVYITDTKATTLQFAEDLDTSQVLTTPKQGSSVAAKTVLLVRSFVQTLASLFVFVCLTVLLHQLAGSLRAWVIAGKVLLAIGQSLAQTGMLFAVSCLNVCV